MNTMTTALQEAGIKTPTVMYRIWNWLKDHPEKTAEDVTKALGSSYPLNTQLTDMYKRGMLTVFKDKSHKKLITGAHPMVFRYSVANPREYVLLPKPKKKSVKLAKPVIQRPQPSLPKPVPKPVPAPTPVSTSQAKLDIDNMTVGEAKRIYAQLQEFFKGQA